MPVSNAVIDECLEGISNKHGVLTPALLLKDAAVTSHPLHGEFEWDDSVAGHKWRLEQAAQLIRAAKFVAVSNDNKEPLKVRTWVVTPDKEGKYVPRKKGLKKVDVRADFINRKLAVLQSWCNETADVEELAPLRKSILRGLSKVRA